MARQLHKKFSAEEVKMLLDKYLNEKVKLVYVLEILKVKRSRFFELLRRYRSDPDNFSIQYRRKIPTRKIAKVVEKSIMNEPRKEKKLIEDERARGGPHCLDTKLPCLTYGEVSLFWLLVSKYTSAGVL